MNALRNFIKAHISDKQEEEIKTAINNLETSLTGTIINLSGPERRRYGSINEQNKLFVNKVFDYSQNQSLLRSPDVDWAEFNNDYNSRNILESCISQIKNLLDGLENAKILHDYDCYQAALDDYAYTNYKAGTSAVGYENKQTDLKQFFTKSKPTTPNN
ncbi:MAG: hypothetical protein MI739_04340 [Bacteroidales bacterium]|nr:hypothetical protein [Bacteroidales bacterium]